VTGGSKVGVKICGLTRGEDARLAQAAGADYLGVVLVPESPRGLAPEEAREVVRETSLPVVVVVANLSPESALRAAEIVGASVIQLHGEEPPAEVEAIRRPGAFQVWKALRVRGSYEVREGLRRYGDVTDGVLLDGWHPEGRGGMGASFSWDEVEGLRREFPPSLSFIAAGGLRPDNVAEAVARLRPHVVDVSSGVESRPGLKDPAAVEAFVRNAGSG
jgi:phosphoribosylanthranilate isomerase